jgi:transposase-like protein
MARKTKLTPEVHQRIVQYVRAGNFRITAAAAAGISPVTLRDWLRRGARGEAPFDSFREDVDAAEAQAEARLVTLVAKAAEHDWRAAAWHLERRVHKRWGKKDPPDPKPKETITADDITAAVREFARQNPDEAARIVAEAAE